MAYSGMNDPDLKAQLQAEDCPQLTLKRERKERNSCITINLDLQSSVPDAIQHDSDQWVLLVQAVELSPLATSKYVNIRLASLDKHFQ